MGIFKWLEERTSMNEVEKLKADIEQEKLAQQMKEKEVEALPVDDLWANVAKSVENDDWIRERSDGKIYVGKKSYDLYSKMTRKKDGLDIWLIKHNENIPSGYRISHSFCIAIKTSGEDNRYIMTNDKESGLLLEVFAKMAQKVYVQTKQAQEAQRLKDIADTRAKYGL
jgi:hypothetical protein